MARVLDRSLTQGIEDCFSESYEEARTKFCNAASESNAELHSLEITRDESGTYTTDIAIVRGSGQGLVVISSGTHGVEGYAGSAVQVSLLKHLKGSAVSPTVVLVHAVNPHGMAHFRRWNENNVDLNRNALFPYQFKKLVEEDRLESNYMGFDALFNPRSPPGWFYRNIGIWFTMAANIARYGLRSLKTALVAATYRQSKGVFYGGQELQPSHALLRDFMATHFSQVKASFVAWIDVHTGLGPCGVDVLLGSGRDADELDGLFPRLPGVFDGFQSVAPKGTDETLELRCQERQEAGSSGSMNQSAGYEFTVGIISEEWITKFFKADSGRALVVTQEFGTRGNLAVARALMLENAGYHYDRKNHEFWRSFTRDAFYVRTPKWKTSILARGKDVFMKMVARTEAVQSRL
mmetsp:Transcript_93288/g.273085  ORF Transcript_93288/g.273085 Transcript_93288/m.273085 type:complete len:407 (-) Transcript_93288:57-1277(-)